MPENDTWGRIIIEDDALVGGFVQVPAVVYFDPHLSDGARATYGALLWYSWKYGRCPDQGTMADDRGLSSRQIKRHIAELKEAGYIEVSQKGLGQPNDYLIKSLAGRGDKNVPSGGTKMSLLGGHSRPFQGDRNVPSHKNDVDSTTQTLSHTRDELATVFFQTMGEGKPSRKERERASAVINELTTEGFTPEVIHEAMRLAAKRGARGPELLPFVVGEAHARFEANAHREAVQVQKTQAEEEERRAIEKAFEDDLAAVEALPAKERKRLESQARATLPATMSEAMVQRVLPGMIAAKVKQKKDE